MFKKRFQSKEIGETITAGDCLRRGREEAGLSLRQVSGELGIKEDYLENLENGNYHELPPQVYVRGFIKSYASFLRIDASQLIKIYNREMAYLGEDDRLRRQEAVSVKRWRDYLVITPKVLTLTGSLFVLGILGYYFYHQVNSFNSKPYLFVESPAADEVVKERDLWVKGRTEEDAILRINGQDISVSGEGNFIQKITLSEGRNALVIEATNRFNRSDRRSLNIIYEKPYAPPQVTEVPVAPTAPTGTADALADTSKDSATSTGDPAQASTPSNPSKASPTKKPTPSPDTAQKTPVTTPPAPDISSPAASEPIPEEETVGEDGGTSADYINP